MKKFLISTLLLTSVNLSALSIYTPDEDYWMVCQILNENNCYITDVKETQRGLIIYYEKN